MKLSFSAKRIYSHLQYVIFVLVIGAFFSCSKENKLMLSAEDLSGEWIEVDTRSDTLHFTSLDGMDIMTLRRGFEMRDGHLLPRLASGPYEYRLENDRISLHWTLSSNSAFETVSFAIQDRRLTIGNFYDSKYGSQIIFERL